VKILGHKSAGMSTYANISDTIVLADYQSVVQPGAVIAGPLADTLRAGQLGQDALDGLKTNFYKTELELGHCLRLPQEGPCECDLYLTCAKFVTTRSTRRGSANASALSASSPTTPRNAAGHAKWNAISGPWCGSRRFSRNGVSRAEMTSDAGGLRAS
jgi:hypothetical protein